MCELRRLLTYSFIKKQPKIKLKIRKYNSIDLGFSWHDIIWLFLVFFLVDFLSNKRQLRLKRYRKSLIVFSIQQRRVRFTHHCETANLYCVVASTSTLCYSQTADILCCRNYPKMWKQVLGWRTVFFFSNFYCRKVNRLTSKS